MLLTIFSYLYHENNAHTYIYIYRKYYNCCVHNWYFDIVYEDNEQIWADTWHWSWSRDNNDNVSTDNIFSHTRKWHTHFNSSLSKLLELKQIFAHNRHACPDSVLINSSFCSVNISFRRSLHYLVFLISTLMFVHSKFYRYIGLSWLSWQRNKEILQISECIFNLLVKKTWWTKVQKYGLIKEGKYYLEMKTLIFSVDID